MAHLKFNSGERVHDWTLHHPLGRGGSAEVWRALDIDNSAVALKILTSTATVKIERFRREVLLVTRLHHQIVLPIVGFRLGNPACYAMPEAETVRQYGRRHAPGLFEWTTLLAELAEGLADLHAHRIVHGDIKPGNFFRLDGSWRLGDFGLAITPDSAPVLAPNEVPGSRHYAAPELHGPRPRAPDWSRCDVYSFGMAMAAILAGKRNPVTAHGDGPVRPEGRAGWNVDFLYLLIQRATQRDAAARLPMREIALALRGWLDAHCGASADAATARPRLSRAR